MNRACALFSRAFGRKPTHAGSAPGRVNLIGDHTDYNDGFVLPMAIEQRTVVVLGPSDGRQWHFVSEQESMRCSFDAREVAKRENRDWTSLIRGVITGFTEVGYALAPACVAVASDVPVGGGLSSSAALAVAAATAIEGALDHRLEPWDKILVCQRAEHGFAGVPCGFMDQAISVLAREHGVMLLDCQSREVRHVPLEGLDAAVLVMNSMVRHDLADGAYAQRRAECALVVERLGRQGAMVPSLRALTPAMVDRLDPCSVEARRARHVMTENERTQAAAAAIMAGDAVATGALMTASHASLRDDYQVSCDALNRLVSLLGEQEGVYGARLTGGGFGGCVVALLQPSHAEQTGRCVADRFHDRTGMIPDWFVTRGGIGAGPEDI